MICLDNTDVIEGGASVDVKVEYTIHGLVGTTFTQLAAGVMSDTLTAALYTAGAAVSVVSIILVNTHTSAVAVTLRLDPADGGNPRYIIPKTISLGAGYSLHTDGARFSVHDANGGVMVGAAGYVKVSDVKAFNIHGGTFTLGVWRTRDINTEDSDDSGICSIAGNQITLAAGSYYCSIFCPAAEVARNVARLYNITDASTEVLGGALYSTAASGIVTNAFIGGKFTIAAQKTFEVQHQGEATKADTGFGINTNMAGVDSVYTIAEFWRL